MPRGLRTRLAALMFLEYAVQGLWVVPLAPFLMGSPHEGGLNMPAGHVALLYATFAIGATLSPLIVGLIADRLFPLQRVLAVLHLIGAALLTATLAWCIQCEKAVLTAFNDRAATVNVEVRLGDGTVSSEPLDGLLEEKSFLRFLAEGRSASLLELSRHWRNKRWFGHLGIELATPTHFEAYEKHNLSGFLYGDDIPERISVLHSAIEPAVQQLRSHPAITAAADRAFPPLFALMLAYACVYLPTVGLSNVVAFRNLPDPARQYGPFRAMGTVGWIVAGLFVGFAAPAVSPLCFLYAAVTSAVLGGLCFLLPHTPPAGKPRTVADALGLPALRMLADRSFLAYLLAALASTSLLTFHNAFTNKFLVDLHVEHAAAVQTLAQPTEILGAILLPWVWARIGIKWMLCLGLLASAARFFMYATAWVPAVVGVGFPLHGIGFALFYIAAALYVDRQAPPDLRASAQGLVTVLTLGLGGLVGNWFAGRVVEYHTSGGVVDWRPVWLVPAVGMLAAAAALALFFREARPRTVES